MLCQNCKKNEATTHIKRVINGETTQAHLCADCAKSLGYDSMFSDFDFGFNFSNMLSSFFNDSALSAIGAHNLRCEKCGSSFNDIVRSGKIGCADCYETFYDKLLPSIQRIHGRSTHEGKVPNGSAEIVKLNEIDELKQKLNKAVEEQNYEKAAELRDKIKELEEGKKDE